MSHKGSATTVQKNKDIWTANLVQYQQSHKRRRIVPVEESSIEEKCRMPHQMQIIGRYQFMGANCKHQRKKRTNSRNFKRSEKIMAKQIKFSICVRSSNTSKA